MQLQLVAFAAALLATGIQAAPLNAVEGNPGQKISPLTSRGASNPQAFFSVSGGRADGHRIAKRKPSRALEAVITYVKRFSQDDTADEGEMSYIQPGARNAQKAFAVKRATASCTVAPAKTTSTQNRAVSTSTSSKTSSTSSKATSTAKPSSSSSSSKPSSTSSSAASAVATGTADTGIVSGYWPSWSSGTLPPENIAWSKYDMLFYAFAIPTSSGSITIDDASMLRRFVKAAKAGNTKAILSLGGWGQSSGFSKSVGSDSARSNFIKSVLNVISTYNLDGVDFDWEYPGNVEGATNDPLDTKNFQTFLEQLRAKVPKGTILSAAVPQQVWQASNGDPVGSVARAGAALDHIVIMNYDVWGSSSTPGPNAPLGNLCGNSTQPVASAAGGVKAWTSAGFPRSKILLGVPSYGYINNSKRTYLKQRSLSTEPVLRADRTTMDASSGLERRASLTSMDGSTTSGQINFNSLVSQGALKFDSSSGTYKAGSGYTKYWDDCSDTPYLSSGSRVVTYDDPDSLYDKANFARLAKIAGVAMWSIDGDMSNNVLINSLAAGLKATS